MPDTPNSMESLNFLRFLLQHLKTLVAVGLVAAVVSSIVSLVMEEQFESKVVMFATVQQSIGDQFFEANKKNDLFAYGETEDAERLLQILNSHRIRDRVIEKYDLYNHYGIDPEEVGSKAAIHLKYGECVHSNLTRFGSIEVRVLDTDPVQAKDMANDMAFLADSVANAMRNDRAAEAYALAQNTLQSTQQQIVALEDSLAVLQASGIYDFESQVASLSSAYGRAMAEGNFKAASILKQDLESISEMANDHNNLSSLLEGAYERSDLLAKSLDMMRVDAESQMPSSFVVDYADVADKKAKPVRWLIVAMSCIVSVVSALLALLGLDAFRRHQLA